MYFNPKHLKGEENYQSFKPWFIILLHRHPKFQARKCGQCLWYLLYITLDYPIFSLLCTLLSVLFCINVFYPKMGDQKRMIYSLISCQDLFFLSKLFSFLGDKFYNLRLSCKNLASQMSLLVVLGLPYQKKSWNYSNHLVHILI